jgi:hypothetical protein
LLGVDKMALADLWLSEILMGGLVGFRRACSARSGHGCQASYSVVQSAGTNRSEVAARRDATSAPAKPTKTGPIKSLGDKTDLASNPADSYMLGRSR